MRKPRFTQAFLIIVVLFALTRTAPVAHAEIGLNIDATALRFIYTPGAGGFGSIGRIDITRGSSSALTAQMLELGGDGLGGGNDTLIDLAKVTSESFPTFDAIFTADVFYLGQPNSYAIVGTYTVKDTTGTTVLEGDYTSDFVTLSSSTLYMGGNLANADGILRPGSPATGWAFVGDSDKTPDNINGVFGGQDGIDGTITMDRWRDVSTLANLFNFEFVGSFPDLDAFFNDAIQASVHADMKVSVVVPAPSAVLLGWIGLALVGWIKRRLA
ncbi:MAG: hypothetical protein GXY44_00075 [Phycisphaerales bacterium]|nr:hypothetical protein [Phycisphaerales bacterium]